MDNIKLDLRGSEGGDQTQQTQDTVHWQIFCEHCGESLVDQLVNYLLKKKLYHGVG